MVIQYYPRPSTKPGMCTVYLRFIDDRGKWCHFSTRVTVGEQHWCRVSNNLLPSHPDYQKLVVTLTRQYQQLHAVMLDLQMQHYAVTAEVVRTLHRNRRNRTTAQPLLTATEPANPVAQVKESAEPGFIQLFQEYTRTAPNITDSVRKQHVSLGVILAEFSRKENWQLTFAGMDMAFYNAFAQHCLYTLDNYNNAFGTKIKRLRTFLRWAETERGIAVNIQSKSRNFKVWKEEKEIITLAPDEVDRLWEWRTHPACKPEYRKYISLFVFGCLSSLRISDIQRAEYLRIEDGLLLGRAKKTGNAFKIPLALDPRIQQILTEYDYNLRLASEQKLNVYIKKILRELGMTEDLTVYRYKLKQDFPAKRQRCDLITSHSARRSWVPNTMKSRRYTQRQVMEIMGTKSDHEFRKYYAVLPADLLP